ncbi:MAG TPA: M20/M25/M40 family metallo-hydrolase, partial [Planctomycetota bacterium]|nr:M20/M25/M40 family metallo-hydrolase [Planctomycetota bacterium]
CHGSAPERGENAIYKMAPIVKEIEELHTKLADDPFLGKGSITISEIKSTSPSLCAVADSCTIHLDRRLTVGETLETSVKEIEDLPSFKKANAKVWVDEYKVPTHTGKVYPMQSYFPTWVLAEDHPFLQLSVKTYKELFEKEPKIDKWTFSTNGIATMGLHNVPTLGFGPGNEVYAHFPNEQIPEKDLVHAMAFYVQFAKNFADHMK